MTWTQTGIIIATFFVLFRWVIPYLFPTVASGRKLKADDDADATLTSEMQLFAGTGEKRSHLRARRRRVDQGGGPV